MEFWGNGRNELNNEDYGRFGFDVHQLKKGADFWLGGIIIPHDKGAVGYSDADVLIHAICDALLGAANLGDIGYHFPDTNPKYKDVDSKILLSKVMKMIREKGYELGNIDSTICLQKPKVGIYIPKDEEIIGLLHECSSRFNFNKSNYY